jgi:hypothetical protein
MQRSTSKVMRREIQFLSLPARRRFIRYPPRDKPAIKSAMMSPTFW